MQGPLDLGAVCEPEPDVSVVRGSREDYTGHPDSAVLIVEVSDSSLDDDRGEKASLYAEAGIADYWILNLVEGQLEAHWDPEPDPSHSYGYRYASVKVFRPGESVTPLARAEISIDVTDLLG